MISIKTVQELSQHSEFPIRMQSQIQTLLDRRIQVCVLETYAEYQAIQEGVEAFSKHASLPRGVSLTDYLEYYVLFPLQIDTPKAVVFYIPVSYVNQILLEEYAM